MHFLWRHCATLLAVVLFTFARSAVAEVAGGRWESSRGDGGARYLSYSATAKLLGRPTPVSVNFYCDPTAGKDMNGTVGFDVYLASIGVLHPFSFGDFEGPDAPARKRRLMQVTVVRKTEPVAAFSVAPSGWYPVADNFAFGVSALSREPRSTPMAILKALAEGADSLHIVITDSRDAKRKLAITVPVAGKRTEFKSLLSGLE